MAKEPYVPSNDSRHADERAVKKDAAHALKQISDMLSKSGHPVDVQIPDRILLHHPVPSFTQNVEDKLKAEDPDPHPTPTKKHPHKRKK